MRNGLTVIVEMGEGMLQAELFLIVFAAAFVKRLIVSPGIGGLCSLPVFTLL
jgi:hypothetical protein